MEKRKRNELVWLQQNEFSFVESLWFWVSVGSCKVLVGVIYRKQSLEYYNNRRSNDLIRQCCRMNTRNLLIIKSIASVLSEPLEIIFNKSLNTIGLPGAWKETIITPIHKKGDKTEVISFTSQVSKILKRTIRDEIVRHLERNDIITKH